MTLSNWHKEHQRHVAEREARDAMKPHPLFVISDPTGHYVDYTNIEDDARDICDERNVEDDDGIGGRWVYGRHVGNGSYEF